MVFMKSAPRTETFATVLYTFTKCYKTQRSIHHNP
jgi:hypothetical protein